MFVNCFSGYGYCLFSILVKAERDAETLGSHLAEDHELVDWWSVTSNPLGAIVRY